MAEPVHEIKKNKNNQVSVPAQPEAAFTPAMAQKDAEDYLTKAGWVFSGRDHRGESSWNDPAGEGPRTGKAQQTVSIPSRDGTDPTMVSQVVCGPVSWRHPMAEAVNIQRARDAASRKAVA